MVALTFKFKHNVQVRVLEDGGPDTRFSHYEHVEGTSTVVVPNEYKDSVMLGETYVRSQYCHDDSFEFIGLIETRHVNAILHVIRRLD